MEVKDMFGIDKLEQDNLTNSSIFLFGKKKCYTRAIACLYMKRVDLRTTVAETTAAFF